MKLFFLSLHTKIYQSSLAFPYLISYLKEKLFPLSYCFSEYPIQEKKEKILFEILNFNPDILLISTYLWNIQLYLELVSDLKKLLPKIIVIAGGPEVSFTPKKYQDYFDFIICGEGETPLLNLLQNKAQKGNNLHPSIHFKGKKGYTLPFEEENIAQIPSPFLKGEYQITGRHFVFWETSRGCPFNCSYCTSSLSKKVRYFPLERVKKEIDFFIQNQIPNVRNIDRTFNLDGKRAVKIWQYILENNQKTLFQFEIRPELLNREQLELLSQFPANWLQFEIGIQSTYLPALEKVNRKNDWEKIQQNISYLKKETKVELHLDLIFGLPLESKKRFLVSVKDIFSFQPDSVQIGRLKVLPGTKIEKEKEIISSVFPPYAVLKTSKLSFKEILFLNLMGELIQIYYNEKKFPYSLPVMVKELFQNNWAIFWEELTLFFQAQGLSSFQGISFKKQTIFLLDFLKEKIKENRYNKKQLEKLLQLDYFLFTGNEIKFTSPKNDKNKHFVKNKTFLQKEKKIKPDTLIKKSNNLRFLNLSSQPEFYPYSLLILLREKGRGKLFFPTSLEHKILSLFYQRKILTFKELKKNLLMDENNLKSSLKLLKNKGFLEW